MKKLGKKTRIRVTFYGISLIITSIVFVTSSFSCVSQIVKTKNEIRDLNLTYNEKLDKEEELKDELNKLQDPEYMAKYAREKYLYSKDDEIIIKIDN